MKKKIITERKSNPKFCSVSKYGLVLLPVVNNFGCLIVSFVVVTTIMDMLLPGGVLSAVSIDNHNRKKLMPNTVTRFVIMYAGGTFEYFAEFVFAEDVLKTIILSFNSWGNSQFFLISVLLKFLLESTKKIV
jgi:hypothetical protein